MTTPAFAVSKFTDADLCYHAARDDREYWTRKRDEAERDLETARGRTAINAAAKRLQQARAELRRLDEAEKPKRRPSRARGSAGASS